MTNTLKQIAADLDAERAAVIAAMAATTVPCSITTEPHGEYNVKITCANCGPVGASDPRFVERIVQSHLEDHAA